MKANVLVYLCTVTLAGCLVDFARSNPESDAASSSDSAFNAPSNWSPQADATPDAWATADDDRVAVPASDAGTDGVTAILDVGSDAATGRDATAATDSSNVLDASVTVDARSDRDATPVDPRDVDDDGDGQTENEGDCDDLNRGAHAGGTENCEDGVDNDCDQLVDQSDETCVEPPPPVSDSVLTITAPRAFPAMRLNAEPYTNTRELGRGWQQSVAVIGRAVVSMAFHAERYPPESLCGIRFNLSIYEDESDVNGNEIVGLDDSWLCESFIDGDGVHIDVLDPDIAILLTVASFEEPFNQNDTGTWSTEGEDGCSALLVFRRTGPCAF